MFAQLTSEVKTAKVKSIVITSRQPCIYQELYVSMDECLPELPHNLKLNEVTGKHLRETNVCVAQA